MEAGSSRALASRVLRRSDTLPSLRLTNVDGETVSTRGYYGRRNLVLFFVGNLRCDDCRRLLRALAEKHDEIRGEESEVIAVVPGSREEARKAAEEMRLPFQVLVDPDGETHRRVGAARESGPAAAIIVVDRFEEVYEARYEREGHRLMDADAVVRSLRFIEVQCPECGAPEWPVIEEPALRQRG
ncbi:MAG: redoxin domain-containing protein [Dehalococcoidia bacterium]|nr:redoxin domain-containing protein [Dehalococcoidia bacterium]